MSPIETFISLAALLITAISAIPTQVHERATSCPSGAFRMKYYYENANGNMVWNGQYAKDLGGPLGSTPSKAEASTSPFSVENDGSLFHPASFYTACILTAPHSTQPTNTTVFFQKDYCYRNGYPMVECIKTPQYNLCSAGENKVIQQCGDYVLFNYDQISSAGGASCGPPLSLFIDNC